MDFQSLVDRLREMFPKQYQNEVEEFIISKNPKSAADVEHLLKEYTYQTSKGWMGNA